MDVLRDLAVAHRYFLRREAVDLGYDDWTLCDAVKRGRLVRIRQGAYCFPDIWQRMSDGERHLARAHASQDLIGGDVALSHTSALAHFGCPLWKAPLERVHITRLDDGPSRLEAKVVHHTGTLTAEDVVMSGERLVTSATRSTLDALTLVGTESGMVAGDWMLNQGLTTFEALWETKNHMQRWPKTLHLEVTLRLLDARSQSVGETLSRALFRKLRLPCPELQVPVHDATGEVIAITDFAWVKHGVYGEFDGRAKYGRLLKPGQNPGDVVFAEKRREDLIRLVTGGTMVRFTWVDLHANSAPSRRLQQLLRASA